MKTGYDTGDGNGGTVKKPSYFDGGTFKNDTSFLTAYAQYYTKFVNDYKAKNINIEIVSPQNEPGYDQNYPSALWEKATYVAFVNALGPVMKAINVKVMLGTMSNAGDNSRNDLDIASAVMADATAKTFVSLAGAQWGVLSKVNEGASMGGLPVWATEHKCGNYPWNPSGYPTYNSSQAPNDQAYGEESWGYIRDAIVKGKVTSYSAWNMVLDTVGKSLDGWPQNGLLVVDRTAKTLTPTAAYYAFRHYSRYVAPGATRIAVTGSKDAVAFKNLDGSVVTEIYNVAAAAKATTLQVASKLYQIEVPAHGWATLRVVP
jgi:glucosylceramidase